LLDFDNVSTRLYEIGEVFEKLYDQSNNFNNRVSIGKNIAIDNMYVTLNNIMVNWGMLILYFL